MNEYNLNLLENKTQKKIKYRDYPVIDEMFNKRISDYLTSFVDIKPHISGKEIIYPLEDGSQIITQLSEDRAGIIIVRAFDCSLKVLNDLEKLTGA